MVQNDSVIIKEKIRQFELGSSGSTFGSDPSTAVWTGPSGIFARPPATCQRNRGVEVHREHLIFIKRNIDRDQTRTERGTWRTKTIVKIFFSNETNLPTMVKLLDFTKVEFQERALHVCADEKYRPCWKWTRKGSRWRKPHALFLQGFKEVGGDEPKIFVVSWKIQINFFVGRVMTANTLLKQKGLAGERWTIKPNVISEIFAKCWEALCEAVVNSSWRMTRVFRIQLGSRFVVWQNISVNVEKATVCRHQGRHRKNLGTLSHTQTNPHNFVRPKIPNFRT